MKEQILFQKIPNPVLDNLSEIELFSSSIKSFRKTLWYHLYPKPEFSAEFLIDQCF
jgi:hypothetical protein